MTAYTFDQIIDFTRTSAATYVANTGFVTQTPASRNLLTYTQEFDNAAWTKTNASAYPFDPAAATLGPELVTNGTFDSGTTGWTDITGSWAVTGGALAGTSIPASAYGPYSNGVATAGRIYLATFTITVASGSLLVRVGNTESSAYSTGGTFSQYFTATSSAATIFQLRAGGAGFTGTIDNISVREVIGGLITAPDGTLTADALIEDTTNAAHTVSSGNATVALGAVTWSVYAKAGTRSWMWLNAFAGGNNRTWFNLANGTVGTTGAGATASITSVGNGWYRCAVTLTSGTTTVSMGINAASADNTTGYAGTAGATAIYLWGAQLEQVPNANLTLGSELVTNGDFSSATGWVAGTGWAISSGTANATAASADLYQLSVAPVSLPVCQITFTVSNYSAGTVRVALMGMSSSTFSGNGTYTVTAANVNGDRALYFVVSGFTGSIDNVSVRQITGTTGMPTTYTRNVGGVYPPRFDYDPVTLAPRGLLIEEQRTNLLTYSEQFDNAAWTKANATVTANSATSPDGTVDADLLVASTSLSQHRLDFATTSTAATHAFSVYAKVGGYNFVYLRLGLNGGFVDLSSGAVSGVTGGYTMTATSVGNGWYRVVLVGAAALNETARINVCQTTTSDFTGDGTSGIYLWGAQLEAGAFATSYIPTVASQVTRTADVATVTGANFSRWYNQSEGTLLIEGSVLSAAGGGQCPTAGFDDGTASNRYIFFKGTGTTALTAYVNANATGSLMTLTANTPFKAALAFNSTGIAACANGGSVSTASGTTTGINRLSMGQNIGGISVLPGHIRRIRYYPTRLSNTQLQALTA